MKKILFSLIALVCSMSMNAQVMKVMKGSEVVDTYIGADYKVVFEEEPSYLLSGSFSVSADKKVKFTKSNLYWDGSAWKFEAKPTDYPTTRATTHVGHFYWTKTAAASYAASYDGTGATTTDKFFADGSDDSHKLTAEGVSGLYILSAGEWKYLLKERSRANSLCKYGVKVNNISNCLVIAPDGFTGTIASTYTLEALETAGLICLPAAGYYFNGGVNNAGSNGYYWSSAPGASDAGRAPCLNFDSGDAEVIDGFRDDGYSLRAVQAEASAATTGTAKRTGNIDVKWVQLWENGPKFAEYNVGAANSKAEDYGGYYCWGKTIDQDSNKEYKKGTDALTGTDDTATNLWGSAWRMPTKAEFDDLIANCDIAWTTNYKESGVKGYIFTGKDDYASNSVFLPAAGSYENGRLVSQGTRGRYWSSMPNTTDGGGGAYYLSFHSSKQSVETSTRTYGISVRAVLAE